MKIRELKKTQGKNQQLENLYRLLSIIGDPCIYNITKAKLDQMSVFCKDFFCSLSHFHAQVVTLKLALVHWEIIQKHAIMLLNGYPRDP